MKAEPRIVPTDDAAFGEHVERLVARQAFRTPDALAARLRTLFPRVVVRASEVSGQEHVWYVYRDGGWSPGFDDAWWTTPLVPSLSVDGDGWIVEANAAGRSLLGLAADEAAPRHFTDFVVPGTLADATEMFAVVAAGRDLSVTTLVRPTGGEVVACDLRAWHDGDHIVAALRLAHDIPVVSPSEVTSVAALDCHPRADTLFARYAAEALARMPEPTPEGLTLRLRRLYPHAQVDAGTDTWTVSRDRQDVAERSSDWWRAAGLASVRYDDQGRILEANEAAVGLLGRDLVGRHWQELVTAGTADEVADILRLIAETGSAEFALPTPLVRRVAVRVRLLHGGPGRDLPDPDAAPCRDDRTGRSGGPDGILTGVSRPGLRHSQKRPSSSGRVRVPGSRSPVSRKPYG